MNNPIKLTVYLQTMGCLALISYAISAVTMTIQQYEVYAKVPSSDDFLLLLLLSNMVGYICGAAVEIALPVLCLAAAILLKNKNSIKTQIDGKMSHD